MKTNPLLASQPSRLPLVPAAYHFAFCNNVLRLPWRGVCATLVALSAVFAYSGCSSSGTPVAPVSPPTLVLAWIASGGQVRTAERPPGGSWAASALDPQATTLTRDLGPALAHDGRATWMLMWVNGPELQYKVGVGGRTPSGGIIWEQAANVGRLVVNTDASPALAYGAGRWVTVFRRVGGQLSVARTDPLSATQWSTPTDIVYADATQRPAVAQRAPALAFGRFGGRDLFVLVYRNAALQAVATTSPDGLTWSPAVVIGSCEKDPALCARDGVLYALLSRQVSVTGAASSYHGFVYKSADASTWTQIANYPRAANNATGAAVAYGGCELLITEQIGGALGGGAFFTGVSARLSTPVGPCADPTGFNIGNDSEVRLGLTNTASVGNSSARTALTFGVSASLTPRRLLITEWRPETVEIYLDEIPGRTLDLADYAIAVKAKVDLIRDVDEPDYEARANLVGNISGGEFLILFEEFGYSGPPITGTFTDPRTGSPVPGIKLPENFFGWNRGGASTALRLSGQGRDGVVDDLMLIGDRPRPSLGGSFIEDTSSAMRLPLPPGPGGSQTRTLSRKWNSQHPVDNDKESDWRIDRVSSWGRP
jgi:hypothetical protein